VIAEKTAGMKRIAMTGRKEDHTDSHSEKNFNLTAVYGIP